MYQSLTLSQCGCRTTHCPHCHSSSFRRHGFFYRHDDARWVRRYYCNGCRKTFSRAGFSLFYRHRHRRLTPIIEKLLGECATLRGLARTLGIDKDTAARRLVLLGIRARHEQNLRLASVAQAQRVEFDELFTFEHTRLKPLSVMLVSDAQRWRLLGCVVARVPASGKLAAKSRARYGHRADESVKARPQLMKELRAFISNQALFVTDADPAYPAVIKTVFPEARHTRHYGAPSAATGQGELKKLVHDPIFCINHQLAMFRAHISRLLRRSWNTTKRVARLEDHIAIFINYYNARLRPRSGIQFELESDKTITC